MLLTGEQLSVSSFGSRLLEVFTKQGHLCIGIDPSAEQLSSWSLPVSAQGARAFSLEILDAAAGNVGLVKLQVAFFEQFGPEGFRVLAEVLELAQSRELLVIADAKRGDIGSTMAGYARAWLSKEALFVCDAVTVSPYLGAESLAESVSVALSNKRGIFVLAATSNPEATVVQSSMSGDKSVASRALSFAGSFSEGDLGSVGVVVGATVQAQEVGLDFNQVLGFPVLVPGFGSQGAQFLGARALLAAYSDVSLCSSSRAIAGSSREGLAERVSKAKAELEVGLRA